MTTQQSRGVGRPDGVVLVSIWFFIQAGLALLGLAAIVIFAFPAVITGTATGSDRYFAVAGVSFAALVVAFFAALPLVTAIGLLGLHGWARWVALVLGALGLIAFPIGTAAGVLIIWYMLSDEAKRAFGVPGSQAPTAEHGSPPAAGEPGAESPEG